MQSNCSISSLLSLLFLLFVVPAASAKNEIDLSKVRVQSGKLPARAAGDRILMRRDFTYKGSPFEMTVVGLGANKLRMEIVHSQHQYTGQLGALSFAGRYREIFKLIINFQRISCGKDNLKLGDVVLSKDPEREKDPDRQHPQYFTWEYECN